jgi:cytosine/adenosine deaminase-related metal-dependent hydrolase
MIRVFTIPVIRIPGIMIRAFTIPVIRTQVIMIPEPQTPVTTIRAFMTPEQLTQACRISRAIWTARGSMTASRTVRRTRTGMRYSHAATNAIKKRVRLVIRWMMPFENACPTIPAISIHSPYSVHPIVLDRAVALAKSKHYPLSTHFLESPAEREWLESNAGGFAAFFKQFFGSTQAVTTVEEFMHRFDSYPTHFVHCTQTTSTERAYLASQGHSIAHCPRSNRLLGCGRLPIEDVTSPMSIATDGLSSNWSLNIWDELRAALMLHHQGPLEKMADRFIRSITSDAATAIRSDAGRLEVDAPADIAVVTLPARCDHSSSLSLHAILHTQRVESVYIDGSERG